MSLISGSSVSSTGGSFMMASGEGSSSGGCLSLKGGTGEHREGVWVWREDSNSGASVEMRQRMLVVVVWED